MTVVQKVVQMDGQITDTSKAVNQYDYGNFGLNNYNAVSITNNNY